MVTERRVYTHLASNSSSVSSRCGFFPLFPPFPILRLRRSPPSSTSSSRLRLLPFSLLRNLSGDRESDRTLGRGERDLDRVLEIEADRGLDRGGGEELSDGVRFFTGGFRSSNSPQCRIETGESGRSRSSVLNLPTV